MRERVLVVAVGDHLGRSEMVLVELANMRNRRKGTEVDQHFRGTEARGRPAWKKTACTAKPRCAKAITAMASTLDELERVLLDIANSPGRGDPGAI